MASTKGASRELGASIAADAACHVVPCEPPEATAAPEVACQVCREFRYIRVACFLAAVVYSVYSIWTFTMGTEADEIAGGCIQAGTALLHAGICWWVSRYGSVHRCISWKFTADKNPITESSCPIARFVQRLDCLSFAKVSVAFQRQKGSSRITEHAALFLITLNSLSIAAGALAGDGSTSTATWYISICPMYGSFILLDFPGATVMVWVCISGLCILLVHFLDAAFGVSPGINALSLAGQMVILFLVALFSFVNKLRYRELMAQLEQRELIQLERSRILKQARDAAVHSAVSRHSFLAHMSHELRTPLNGLLGMCSLLGDTSPSEEQRELLDVMLKSGKQLRSVIDDILDYSKIEAGKLVMDPRPFSAALVVEDVTMLFAQDSRDRNIDLICHVHPGVPDTVIGDELRLRQCLSNFLANALKFTKQGEIVVTVRLVLKGAPWGTASHDMDEDSAPGEWALGGDEEEIKKQGPTGGRKKSSSLGQGAQAWGPAVEGPPAMDLRPRRASVASSSPSQQYMRGPRSRLAYGLEELSRVTGHVSPYPSASTPVKDSLGSNGRGVNEYSGQSGAWVGPGAGQMPAGPRKSPCFFSKDGIFQRLASSSGALRGERCGGGSRAGDEELGAIGKGRWKSWTARLGLKDTSATGWDDREGRGARRPRHRSSEAEDGSESAGSSHYGDTDGPPPGLSALHPEHALHGHTMSGSGPWPRRLSTSSPNAGAVMASSGSFSRGTIDSELLRRGAMSCGDLGLGGLDCSGSGGGMGPGGSLKSACRACAAEGGCAEDSAGSAGVAASHTCIRGRNSSIGDGGTRASGGGGGGTVSSTSAKQARSDTVMIEYSVRDTGAGIAEADLERLFKPFCAIGGHHQVDRFGSTGLGTFLCYNLVKAMGGSGPVVRSKLGAGSEFMFRLPLVMSPPLPAPQPQPVATTHPHPHALLASTDSRESPISGAGGGGGVSARNSGVSVASQSNSGGTSASLNASKATGVLTAPSMPPAMAAVGAAAVTAAAEVSRSGASERGKMSPGVGPSSNNHNNNSHSNSHNNGTTSGHLSHPQTSQPLARGQRAPHRLASPTPADAPPATAAMSASAGGARAVLAAAPEPPTTSLMISVGDSSRNDPNNNNGSTNNFIDSRNNNLKLQRSSPAPFLLDATSPTGTALISTHREGQFTPGLTNILTTGAALSSSSSGLSSSSTSVALHPVRDDTPLPSSRLCGRVRRSKSFRVPSSMTPLGGAVSTGGSPSPSAAGQTLSRSPLASRSWRGPSAHVGASAVLAAEAPAVSASAGHSGGLFPPPSPFCTAGGSQAGAAAASGRAVCVGEDSGGGLDACLAKDKVSGHASADGPGAGIRDGPPDGQGAGDASKDSVQDASSNSEAPCASSQYREVVTDGTAGIIQQETCGAAGGSNNREGSLAANAGSAGPRVDGSASSGKGASVSAITSNEMHAGIGSNGDGTHVSIVVDAMRGSSSSSAHGSASINSIRGNAQVLSPNPTPTVVETAASQLTREGEMEGPGQRQGGLPGSSGQQGHAGHGHGHGHGPAGIPAAAVNQGVAAASPCVAAWPGDVAAEGESAMHPRVLVGIPAAATIELVEARRGQEPSRGPLGLRGGSQQKGEDLRDQVAPQDHGSAQQAQPSGSSQIAGRLARMFLSKGKRGAAPTAGPVPGGGQGRVLELSPSWRSFSDARSPGGDTPDSSGASSAHRQRHSIDGTGTATGGGWGGQGGMTRSWCVGIGAVDSSEGEGGLSSCSEDDTRPILGRGGKRTPTSSPLHVKTSSGAGLAGPPSIVTGRAGIVIEGTAMASSSEDDGGDNDDVDADESVALRGVKGCSTSASSSRGHPRAGSGCLANLTLAVRGDSSGGYSAVSGGGSSPDGTPSLGRGALVEGEGVSPRAMLRDTYPRSPLSRSTSQGELQAYAQGGGDTAAGSGRGVSGSGGSSPVGSRSPRSSMAPATAAAAPLGALGAALRVAGGIASDASGNAGGPKVSRATGGKASKSAAFTDGNVAARREYREPVSPGGGSPPSAGVGSSGGVPRLEHRHPPGVFCHNCADDHHDVNDERVVIVPPLPRLLSASARRPKIARSVSTDIVRNRDLAEVMSASASSDASDVSGDDGRDGFGGGGGMRLPLLRVQPLALPTNSEEGDAAVVTSPSLRGSWSAARQGTGEVASGQTSSPPAAGFAPGAATWQPTFSLHAHEASPLGGPPTPPSLDVLTYLEDVATPPPPVTDDEQFLGAHNDPFMITNGDSSDGGIFDTGRTTADSSPAASGTRHAAAVVAMRDLYGVRVTPQASKGGTPVGGGRGGLDLGMVTGEDAGCSSHGSSRAGPTSALPAGAPPLRGCSCLFVDTWSSGCALKDWGKRVGLAGSLLCWPRLCMDEEATLATALSMMSYDDMARNLQSPEGVISACLYDEGSGSAQFKPPSVSDSRGSRPSGQYGASEGGTMGGTGEYPTASNTNSTYNATNASSVPMGHISSMGPTASTTTGAGIVGANASNIGPSNGPSSYSYGDVCHCLDRSTSSNNGTGGLLTNRPVTTTSFTNTKTMTGVGSGSGSNRHIPAVVSMHRVWWSFAEVVDYLSTYNFVVLSGLTELMVEMAESTPGGGLLPGIMEPFLTGDPADASRTRGGAGFTGGGAGYGSAAYGSSQGQAYAAGMAPGLPTPASFSLAATPTANAGEGGSSVGAAASIAIPAGRTSGGGGGGGVSAGGTSGNTGRPRTPGSTYMGPGYLGNTKPGASGSSTSSAGAGSAPGPAAPAPFSRDDFRKAFWGQGVWLTRPVLLTAIAVAARRKHDQIHRAQHMGRLLPSVAPLHLIVLTSQVVSEPRQARLRAKFGPASLMLKPVPYVRLRRAMARMLAVSEETSASAAIAAVSTKPASPPASSASSLEPPSGSMGMPRGAPPGDSAGAAAWAGWQTGPGNGEGAAGSHEAAAALQFSASTSGDGNVAVARISIPALAVSSQPMSLPAVITLEAGSMTSAPAGPLPSSYYSVPPTAPSRGSPGSAPDDLSQPLLTRMAACLPSAGADNGERQRGDHVVSWLDSVGGSGAPTAPLAPRLASPSPPLSVSASPPLDLRYAPPLLSASLLLWGPEAPGVMAGGLTQSGPAAGVVLAPPAGVSMFGPVEPGERRGIAEGRPSGAPAPQVPAQGSLLRALQGRGHPGTLRSAPGLADVDQSTWEVADASATLTATLFNGGKVASAIAAAAPAAAPAPAPAPPAAAVAAAVAAAAATDGIVHGTRNGARAADASRPLTQLGVGGKSAAIPVTRPSHSGPSPPSSHIPTSPFNINPQASPPAPGASLSLPLSPSSTSSVAAGAGGGAALSPPSSSSLLSLRCLVAEDHAINRMVITKMLRKLGVAADVVEDGELALEALKRGGGGYYHVVLLDLHMTASVLPENRAEASAAGMDCFLSKPLTVTGLRQALTRALQVAATGVRDGEIFVPEMS
eukprot:jgi/Mesvir1/12322/Mv00513-RA.1